MATLEQWENYKKYVEEYNAVVDADNKETALKQFRIVTVRHKFLWWTWETQHRVWNYFPPYLRENIQPSLEGYLDWMIAKQLITS